MSSPGFFYADPNSPEAKRQAMAQALMQRSAPAPTGMFGGMADAGNSVFNAYAQKKMLDDNKWAAQGIEPVKVTPQQTGGGFMSGLSNLFNFGGGK